MTRFALALGLSLVTLGSGCDRFAPPPAPKARPKQAVTTIAAKPSASQDLTPPLIPSSDHYAVPFAWEKANDEPLAQARSFIADMLRDNQNHPQRERGKPNSDATQKPQAPRATVVACADPRVLVDSWDATPEDDEFTIRNLGNLVSTSFGSVQYGIEQLQTPLLVILGHTGCTAIASAQQDRSQFAEPVRKDLDLLHVTPEPPRPKAGSTVTTEAVVSNVHRQVRLALDRFGPRIVTGRLTVIGAVLDLQDELGKGVGRISIIDVNGNSEPRRLRAFVDAVQESNGKPDAHDAGVAEPEPASSADESGLDPIARDLRAAFSALAEKANKQAPQPKHR